MARARTIATRCCCPPESRSGNSSRLSARPKRPSRSTALRVGLPRSTVRSALRRAERDVPQHAHVREEVERLEDDADALADAVDVRRGRAVTSVPSTHDPAAVDRLEQVHAAQQRRLARPGRADQADDLVLGDRQVDALQHLELAEGLAHAARGRSASAAALTSRLRGELPATVARDQPVREARERDRDQDEEQRRREVGRVVEGRGHVDLGLAERLHDAEQRDRAVSFCSPMKSLRSGGITRRTACGRIDEAERLPVREPERSGGGRLARVYRLDAGAVDLGDVGGVDEHERDGAPERSPRWARPESWSAGAPKPRM